MSLNCGHLVEELFSVPLQESEENDFIYLVSAEYLVVKSSKLYVYLLYSKHFNLV